MKKLKFFISKSIINLFSINQIDNDDGQKAKSFNEKKTFY